MFFFPDYFDHYYYYIYSKSESLSCSDCTYFFHSSVALHTLAVGSDVNVTWPNDHRTQLNTHTLFVAQPQHMENKYSIALTVTIIIPVDQLSN